MYVYIHIPLSARPISSVVKRRCSARWRRRRRAWRSTLSLQLHHSRPVLLGVGVTPTRPIAFLLGWRCSAGWWWIWGRRRIQHVTLLIPLHLPRSVPPSNHTPSLYILKMEVQRRVMAEMETKAATVYILTRTSATLYSSYTVTSLTSRSSLSACPIVYY